MQISKPKTYKYLYFDLDNTLWDFTTNSESTLFDLMHQYFPEVADKYKEFLTVYYIINKKLWVHYRKGFLTKEVLRTKRFVDAFKQIGISDETRINQFGEEYIARSPLKTALFPNALETLAYLKDKGYRLFLLTNGFKEVQIVKISKSGLAPFFEKMITSDESGYQKPHRKIFEYALKTVNAVKKQSLMIGDDVDTDIAGAKKFGMDQVYFNPGKKPHDLDVTFEIGCLSDLRLFL